MQYRQEGQAAKASWAALSICVHHLRVTGNPAAAAGWARRSERLLPRAELARVILMRALATQDWQEIESAADRAAERLTRCGAHDVSLRQVHGECLVRVYGDGEELKRYMVGPLPCGTSLSHAAS